MISEEINADLDTDMLLENIRDTDVKDLAPISIEFFNKRKNQSTKLINNSDTNLHIKGKNTDFKFSLIDRVWVKKIIINTDNYATWDSLECGWSLDEKHTTRKIPLIDNCFTLKINDFIDSFNFKPPSKLFQQPLIKSIKVIGFSMSDFHDVCNSIIEIDDYKDKIITQTESIIEEARTAEESIGTLQQEINERKEEFINIESDVNEIKDKNAELNEINRGLKSDESDITKRIESADDSLDSKGIERKSLNQEIAKSKTELKQLNEDINMFPSEIAGFVNEGEKALRKYYFLAGIPLILLVLVVYSLFSSAVELTTIFEVNKNASILSILLTRLPYVTVSCMVIFACFGLTKFFVNQMVNINQQRMNLNKISIIANDVSSSSSIGIDMDDSTKYHLRTKLKMELLKEHLKEEINQKYSYDDQESLFVDSELEKSSDK